MTEPRDPRGPREPLGLAELVGQVEARWDGAREDQVWARLREGQLGARPSLGGWRWGLGLASAGAAIGVVAWVLAAAAPSGPGLPGAGPTIAVEPMAAAASEDGDAGAVALADGSRLWPGEGAQYRLTRVDAAEVEVEITSGALRFDVRPDPSRRFRVRAGGVTVEVIGTAFTVARAATRVEIAVARGEVRVAAFGATPVTLAAGDRLELDLADEQGRAGQGPTASPEPEPEPGPAPASAPAKPRRAPSLRWRNLSEAGQLDEAWRALDGGGFVDRDDPEALMAAADVARLSKHPKAALRWLAIVVDAHPRSPLAPLAAFTRGRLLLEQLGDPSGAAAAFAKAVSLDPSGPLVEDARAREVEALAKAGQPSEAKAKAEDYVARYPTGARRRAVERWGGLD